MRKTILFITFLTCLLGLTISTEAQKRKLRKPKVAVVLTNETKEAAGKVAIQVNNVSKFLYLLGGIARGIEDIDRDVKSGKIAAKSKVANDNETFKQNVLVGIRNLRTGLIQLESDFRAKPKLQPYLASIQGITELSGTAEDQAISGNLTASGKTLLLVIEKLAASLVALP
jgi:hypothetical protein